MTFTIMLVKLGKGKRCMKLIGETCSGVPFYYYHLLDEAKLNGAPLRALCMKITATGWTVLGSLTSCLLVN